MIVNAPNWVGTSINAIAGTRGLRGLGQDTGSGGPDPIDISGLVPATGPDANQVASLQVGNLAAQTSASGQYSLNPSTGQLVTNMIPGISNSGLIMLAAVAIGIAMLGGIARGR